MSDIEENYAVKILREANGSVALVERWMLDGEQHRVGGPSYLERDPETGFIVCEEWTYMGACHRRQGPSRITRDGKTGKVLSESWHQEGVLHRENGPAMITYDPKTGAVKEAVWMIHGKEVPPPFAGKPTEPSPQGPR